MSRTRRRPRPIELLSGRVLAFERPLLVGIVNVTPDSFSDGGRFDGVEGALAQATALVAAGADMLDIGGESTRPGAALVAATTELDRVLPVLEALRGRVEVPLSIDTSKAAVAAAALRCGVDVVNDVSALSDPEMAALVAGAGAALVVMHARPEPAGAAPVVYDDLVAEVRRALAAAVARAVAAGLPRHHVMVDPGIGFGKTAEHNLTLTRRLGELGELGLPIYYGPSRKRFLGAVTGRDLGDRDRATAAACCAAVLAGADVLRVHDVAAVRDAVLVAAAVRDAG